MQAKKRLTPPTAWDSGTFRFGGNREKSAFVARPAHACGF